MPNPPKPSALKALQGNPGKRAINKNEPRPDPGAPRMPTGMSAAARAEWKRIVPELMKLGVLTVVDGAALGAYCEAYSESKQAQTIIRREGMTIRTMFLNPKTEALVIGGIKPHPAVAIRDKAAKRMKSFLIEFGLTPASRSRIQILPPIKPDDAKQSPLKKFLASKKGGTGTGTRLQ